MTDQMERQEEHPEADELTARYAFALLTMRAETPEGVWLPKDFEGVYRDAWSELVDTVGETEAIDGVILHLANMGDYLLKALAVTSGKTHGEWLQNLRVDYVDDASEETK